MGQENIKHFTKYERFIFIVLKSVWQVSVPSLYMFVFHSSVLFSMDCILVTVINRRNLPLQVTLKGTEV